MQSIVKALTWEYFARNRWMWLLILLANVPALLILFPLRWISGSDAYMASRELISIQLILFLCMVFTVGMGVLQTQGSARRLYLLPLPTWKIASFFYWGGALLVGIQVGLLLWIWRFLVPVDWPIAGLILFAVVSWGAMQPVFRGVMQSLWWIAAAIAILIALFQWLLFKHGIPLRRGGMMSPDLHYWSTISIGDVLIASVTLGLGYLLTVWRMAVDRSGRRQMSLLERIDTAYERLQVRFFAGAKRFKSPQHAFVWFDFLDRLITIPALIICCLIFTWLVATGVAVLTQDPVSLLRNATGGTHLAAMLQVFLTFVLGFIGIFGQSISQFEGNDQELRVPKSTPLGLNRFLHTLPYSPGCKARAMLKTSGAACGIASLSILCSFALISLIGWRWNIDLTSASDLKIHFLKYLTAVLFSSFFLSFALSSAAVSFGHLFRRIDLWTLAILTASILIACRVTVATSVTAGLCACVLSALITTTIQSVTSKDVTLGVATTVWFIGLGLVLLLLQLLSNELGATGALLFTSLIGLAMTPIFSTTAGLRAARTT